MTDQIYYKVQYPLKKVINMIKNIDTEDPFVGITMDNIEEKGYEELNNFLNMWENEGKENFEKVIKKLRKTQ
ncbi:MAG: hypothetical protein ACOCQW_04550 [Halanaerobiaceae bacterium]